MILSKRQGIYYIYWVDSSGRRHKVSTRTRTKSEALRFVQTFSPDTTTETPPRPASPALSTFVEDFLRFAASTYSVATVELFKHALCRFQLSAGDCLLSTLTARHVDQYKAMRLSRVCATTVNIELRALRSIFNTAIRWELIQTNPFKNVALPRLPQQLPAYFTRDDFARLRDAIKEKWLRELVEFAVLTGMRRGEILQLQWNQVDLQKRVITIQSSPNFKTKAGRLRVVPLSDAAVAILTMKQGSATSEHVFTYLSRPFKGDHVIRNFRKYIKKLGLSPRLNFHSLRHTQATWLVQAGVSIYQVSKILGHSSVVVTQMHYASLEAGELHAEVNRIGSL